MNTEIRKILNGIGIYVLFFTLGDIFMLKGGPGPLSWVLILAGAAGAVWHFYRNWPRLGRRRPGERV